MKKADICLFLFSLAGDVIYFVVRIYIFKILRRGRQTISDVMEGINDGKKKGKIRLTVIIRKKERKKEVKKRMCSSFHP